MKIIIKNYNAKMPKYGLTEIVKLQGDNYPLKIQAIIDINTDPITVEYSLEAKNYKQNLDRIVNQLKGYVAKRYFLPGNTAYIYLVSDENNNIWDLYEYQLEYY